MPPLDRIPEDLDIDDEEPLYDELLVDELLYLGELLLVLALELRL